MFSVEHESVFVGLGPGKADTPCAANGGMECIRCWYRVAYRSKVGVKVFATVSDHIRLRRRHRAGAAWATLAWPPPRFLRPTHRTPMIRS